jgi:hypothetical protein
VFKAAMVEGNQYDIWTDKRKGWWYSPLPSQIPEVWAEYKSICSLPARREEKDRLMQIENMVLAGGTTISEEDMKEYKRSNPVLWWRPLSSLRCPGCGEQGIPVGSTFRAPPVKDNRGWAKVEELLKGGEMFSYCLTREGEKELMTEAEVEKARVKNASAWEEMKARRIAELKTTQGRTEEESRRLMLIRAQKSNAEEWVVL